MRTALVRRTVLTASAVSLALLATACGSDKADTKTDAKPSAGATSAAPAVKGKTDAELAALLVTPADVPDHVASKEGTDELNKADSQSPTVDKAQCQTLADVQSLRKTGKPTGIARTALAAKPKEAAPGASEQEKIEAITKALAVTTTAVSLASYEGKGAEEVLASVKAAGTACAGGYTVTEGTDKTKIESIKPGTAAVAGDDSVTLVSRMDLEDGDKADFLLTLVRKGNTLVTFHSFSLMGAAVESPKTLTDAQMKKLG